MRIERAAIVGFGAIGCIYGRRLLKYMGEDFRIVAGGKRGERLKANGETFNGEHLDLNVVDPAEENWKPQLILFSVKNYQLESAIKDVENLVTPETILLTIINGVSARDKIKEAFPENTVLYGLSRSDASRGPEGVICTWEGPIEFGEANNAVMTDEVKAVKELFDAAEIKNDVCEDMLRASWLKFMRNVGMNQLSAEAGCTYGGFNIPEYETALYEIMDEVRAVAAAKGINLTKEDVEECVAIAKRSDAGAKTSMLQDMEAGRQTEVDSFSGVIIEEGAKLGVPTPWNRVLNFLIKGREKYQKL